MVIVTATATNCTVIHSDDQNWPEESTSAYCASPTHTRRFAADDLVEAVVLQRDDDQPDQRDQQHQAEHQDQRRDHQVRGRPSAAAAGRPVVAARASVRCPARCAAIGWSFPVTSTAVEQRPARARSGMAAGSDRRRPRSVPGRPARRVLSC